MICGLPNEIEDKISLQDFSPSKAIVEVHSSSRPVVHDIPANNVLPGDGLEVGGSLLAVESNVMDVILLDQIVCWVVWLKGQHHFRLR